MSVRHWRLPVLLAASSFIFCILVGSAPAQLLGPEFQVNTYTTGHQQKPAVAADRLGGFIVTWESYPQDGSSFGVFGQRFDSASLPLGSEFRVNTYTTSSQGGPAVAADDSGDFVVIWVSTDQVGSSTDVFGQRFDSTGVPVGGEFRVNSYTTLQQDSADVAAEGSGEFVVAWSSCCQDGSSDGIFGQRFDSAGLPLGSEFLVNTYTTSGQYGPSVAVGESGEFVVVWSTIWAGGGSYDTFGQRFAAAGQRVGSEFRVNTYTASWQANPAVAATWGAGFVVVWESYGQDGSGLGVFAQRYDPAGLPLGGEFQVNSFTTDRQFSPAVAADGAGNFVVVWVSKGQGGGFYDVIGRRFDAAGSGVGGEFRVNSYTTDAQRYPAVAAVGVEDFVVVWQSHGQDGSEWGVYGQRVTFPYFYDGFEAGDFSAWSFVCNAGDICP